jgi:hypothetical protein
MCSERSESSFALGNQQAAERAFRYPLSSAEQSEWRKREGAGENRDVEFGVDEGGGTYRHDDEQLRPCADAQS